MMSIRSSLMMAQIARQKKVIKKDSELYVRSIWDPKKTPPADAVLLIPKKADTSSSCCTTQRFTLDANGWEYEVYFIMENGEPDPRISGNTISLYVDPKDFKEGEPKFK